MDRLSLSVATIGSGAMSISLQPGKLNRSIKRQAPKKSNLFLAPAFLSRKHVSDSHDLMLIFIDERQFELVRNDAFIEIGGKDVLA